MIALDRIRVDKIERKIDIIKKIICIKTVPPNLKKISTLPC